MTAHGRTRTNLSVLHLISAAHFTRAVRTLEQRHRNNKFGPFWEEVLANATAAVFLVVSSLESYANELFVDADIHFAETRPEVMEKLWELLEQKSILEKYEMAVLLNHGAPFDRGARPYQDIYALVRLRNALMHFKPEWFDERKEHEKLTLILTPFMSKSPFFPETEPLFPRGWASASCATWALESALAFLTDFEKCTAVKPRVDKFVERIRVTSMLAL